jgi:spoIIIJ-associated protein
MEWVEITAKTLDEARERALDTLGVDEQDVELEVLEEPRGGLFRRGQARVRARVRPTQVRPKVDRRDRRRRRDDGERRDERGTERADRGGRGRRGGRGDGDGADGPKQTDNGGDASGTTVELGTDEAGSPASRSETSPGRAAGGRRRRGGRGSQSGRTAGAEAGVDRGEEGADMAELTIDEQAGVVADFLTGLAEQFGIEGSQTETERVDDGTVEIRLTGGDLGLLIGPKGQTLFLIQELARTTVQRRGGGIHEGRVRIDIAGYRQRRSEALARFTEQVAQDVLSSGKPKSLEPMNPADRKVVHDTVNDIEGVRTISEGEEPRRRVVLLPTDS